jgi:fermentation-respiration switch protein FrsA (DUF1100 family)
VKFLLLSLLTIYLVVACAMYFGQRHFLYFPDARRTSPADADLPDVAERTIATPDGETLIAWYGKAKPGQPTLLYFHGNGGALEVRRERIRKYLNRGRGVFMLAYRGYSGSSGTPSEKANVADAKLAYQALVKEGVPARDIIIYGESLGTGVAVQVAGDVPAGGLILDSPFTSVVDRASELYPWLPVRLLMHDRYESIRFIDRVRLPLLILHGEADVVIPVEMGRKLFAAANEPKTLMTLPGAGHDDHYLFGSYDHINGWIDRLRAGKISSGNRASP